MWRLSFQQHQSKARSSILLPFLSLIIIYTTTVNAQFVPPCESFLPYSYDSGNISNPSSQQQQVSPAVVLIDTITVSHTFTPWIQLDLSQTILAPNVQLQLEGSAQTQVLDAHALYANNGYSAVFDGESVNVKLVYDPTFVSSSTIVAPTPSKNNGLVWNAFRGNKPPKKPSSPSPPPPISSSSSRLVISNIKVGLCNNNNDDADGEITVSTICGSTDDRIKSYDVRQGRMGGCTAWLIGKNIFLRAGHCGDPNESTRMHFTSEDSNAPIVDQYAVDISTYKYLNGGVGKDWAIGRLHSNTSTGLLPGVAQSAKCNTTGGDATCGWYKLGNAPSKTSGNTIRITGYGVHDTEGRLQKTHVGALTSISSTSLQYSTDSEVCRRNDMLLHHGLQSWYLLQRFLFCRCEANKQSNSFFVFRPSTIHVHHCSGDDPVLCTYPIKTIIKGRELGLTRRARRDWSCHWYSYSWWMFEIGRGQ